MGIKPLQLPTTCKADAAQRISEIATQSTGKVFFTAHCEQRMIQRAISRRQVFNVLRDGLVLGDVQWSAEDESGWKMRLKRISAGAEIVVIAKLVDRGNECVVAITTFEDL